MKLELKGSSAEILSALGDRKFMDGLKEQITDILQSAVDKAELDKALTERVQIAMSRRLDNEIRQAMKEAICIEAAPGSRTGYRVSGWASKEVTQALEDVTTLRTNLRTLIMKDAHDAIGELLPRFQESLMNSVVNASIEQAVAKRLNNVPIEDIIESAIRKILAGK